VLRARECSPFKSRLNFDRRKRNLTQVLEFYSNGNNVCALADSELRICSYLMKREADVVLPTASNILDIISR
jgi:hypothetical protein